MRYTFVLRDTTCGHHAWSDTCGLGPRLDGMCLNCAPTVDPAFSERTFAVWLFKVLS